MAIITGDDGPNNLRGGGAPDRISGLGGNDRLSGGSGGDTVLGGLDDDTVLGGGGADVLEGGGDRGDNDILFTGGTLTAFKVGDTLTGGGGADRFLFTADESDHDRITDFRPGVDRLEIDGARRADVTQQVITDGPLGPGLLIITDEARGEDDGLFLDGVTAPLTVGDDLFFV